MLSLAHNTPPTKVTLAQSAIWVMFTEDMWEWSASGSQQVSFLQHTWTRNLLYISAHKCSFLIWQYVHNELYGRLTHWTTLYYKKVSCRQASLSLPALLKRDERGGAERGREERKKSPHGSPLPISHCSMTRQIREVESVRLCVLKLAPNTNCPHYFWSHV